ncbi:uncharacterized protein M421DRAFT_8371 [Didymella exigua CBS 183.55]|uniref:Uncharacterized protein n=1 Tax=Didymella exigua CBS 183.55 TaxID=1150837 RepID=A0A6A5RH44_9PLEO|nr:uncharacterized protein M421DRAFT_8371 [Didymella exigua CBS 183.55]KAF1924927.1 hypothetical protein M421DRAFT_8371 [Didymella exigua CBS 183.55]
MSKLTQRTIAHRLRKRASQPHIGNSVIDIHCSTLHEMSEPGFLSLKTLLNPINLRRGAQYSQFRIGIPIPSAEVEGAGDNQQGVDTNPSRKSRDKPETGSKMLVFNIALNPVHLRRGFQYVGIPRGLQAEHSGVEFDQCEQDNREFDSETDQELGHPDSIREWYTDDQIAEFVTYTRECLISTPPRPLITLCNITTLASPPSPSCLMLRDAVRAGHAQLARSTDITEVYTVGAPPPVAPFRGGFGADWWHGLTPAQVLAGPLAERRDVQNAEKTLQMSTRATRRRSRWLAEEQEKTAEGVKRQKRRSG